MQCSSASCYFDDGVRDGPFFISSIRQILDGLTQIKYQILSLHHHGMSTQYMLSNGYPCPFGRSSLRQ
jgi:hypothetical protein